MKIIHFTNGRCNPDSANGVEKTIYHLAVNQALLGHQIHVFGISDKDIIRIPGVDVRNFFPPRFPWRLSESLFEQILEIAPDIVHIHCMYLPQNVVLGNKLCKAGIPYVVTPNGNCSSVVMSRRAYLKYPFKLFIERPYLNRALAVHSVGDSASIQSYGIKTSIITSPNGIDLNSIPSEIDRDPILLACPNWKDRIIFLYLGRLDTEQKGLDLMIRGFAKALETNPGMGLVLVGPDWKNRRRQLVDLVSKLGITQSVYFAGPSYGKEKFDYLKSCNYFVHTSRWEGLSFSVVEALACGKPCMVTPAANPANLIGKYPAGAEVLPNSEAIAESFIFFSSIDTRTKQIMENAAIKLIDSELQWNQSAKKLTNGYVDLLDQKNAIR